MALVVARHVCSGYIVVSTTRTHHGGHAEKGRGKAASSENREIAYACFVMVLEPFPPTTYHGQESARGGHTGSYSKAMFDMSRIVCELEKAASGYSRKHPASVRL